MAIKIAVLVENTVGIPAGQPGGLVGEWGLAAHLDFGDEQILFDAGEQGNLLGNARQMEVDLQRVSRVVLSHGHYDHTGGLLDFLKLRGSVPIYAHPELFMPHYERKQPPQEDLYIGVPLPVEQLTAEGAQFCWHREPVQIRPDLWLSGEIPRQTDFEAGDSRLVLKQGETVRKDPFSDDMSLFYASGQGLVIILGCAHAGLVNIVEHARRVTGVQKVRAIVGGTHLGPAPLEQQERTIAYLRSLNLEVLAPNHCTGLPMAARLAAEFPDCFRWAPAGTVVEL